MYLARSKYAVTVLVVVIVLAISSVDSSQLCRKVCYCYRIRHRPICAINSSGERKTFQSECLLECGKCNEPSKDWKFQSDGECAA